MLHHHGKIQNKFLLGLACIFLLLGGVFLFSLNMHLRELLHIEAEAKAEVVFSNLSALQTYVRSILRPTVRDSLPPGEFLLEAMSSSFVTRKVLVDLPAQRDQYIFRRVALWPRNPDSAANDIERELIAYFQAHPQQDTYRAYRFVNGAEFYVMARPVRFEKECLPCHGAPKDAPRVLIERYGDKLGFGHEEGDLAGLDFVGMPADKSRKHIQESITLFGGYFFAVAAGVFLLILIFFNRLVVTNLRRLSGIFREQFDGPKDKDILDRLDEGDEINSLLEAFRSFAAHLREARIQLEDYAANLEDKVRGRTEDLRQEALEHRTDVRLFVELLDDLNRSQGHEELIESVLPRVARRFGASRVVYVCATSGRNRYVWPGADSESLVPGDWQDMLAAGVVRLEADKAFVPVSASDLNRGLMGMFWNDGQRPELAPEVLMALGQQLGIAIENLEAVDALLRQNRMLELIFEGITDPLLLVDESGAVILANSSARALAEAIRPGSRLPTWSAGISAGAPTDGALAEAITRETPSGLEFELPGARTLAVSVYPLRAGGESGRAVVYVRETTVEKRLLAQMQQSEKLAALGRLAAGLAHEINNPLGVISCYAQLLQNSQKGAQAQEDLAVIVRHTKKAQKVLQDLLGLARVNKTSSGPCDLGAVVVDLAKIFQVQSAKADLILNLDLTPDLPEVRADCSSLEQILTNLLVNAFDAAPDAGAVITVRTRSGPDPGSVLLTVSDNGPGIAPEHLGQIFDPFFTTKEIGKGTGLGLTVVHELMRELGGGVEVVGSPGATFRLTFPAQAPNPAGDKQAPMGETVSGACS